MISSRVLLYFRPYTRTRRRRVFRGKRRCSSRHNVTSCPVYVWPPVCACTYIWCLRVHARGCVCVYVCGCVCVDTMDADVTGQSTTTTTTVQGVPPIGNYTLLYIHVRYMFTPRIHTYIRFMYVYMYVTYEYVRIGETRHCF